MPATVHEAVRRAVGHRLHGDKTAKAVAGSASLRAMRTRLWLRGAVALGFIMVASGCGPPPPPKLMPIAGSTLEVSEGDGGLVRFPVQFEFDCAGEPSVGGWTETTDGTATASDGDYVPFSDVPSQDLAVIVNCVEDRAVLSVFVTIVGDERPEPNEMFTVSVWEGTDRWSQTVTIVDDDGSGAPVEPTTTLAPPDDAATPAPGGPEPPPTATAAPADSTPDPPAATADPAAPTQPTSPPATAGPTSPTEEPTTTAVPTSPTTPEPTTTTVPSPTTAPTEEPTPAPAPPLAWSQGVSIVCDANLDATSLVQTYIIRDSVTDEDLTSFAGATATLQVTAEQGSTGSTSAVVTGASVSFTVGLNPPIPNATNVTFSLTIDGAPINLSSGGTRINQGACPPP